MKATLLLLLPMAAICPAIIYLRNENPNGSLSEVEFTPSRSTPSFVPFSSQPRKALTRPSSLAGSPKKITHPHSTDTGDVSDSSRSVVYSSETERTSAPLFRKSKSNPSGNLLSQHPAIPPSSPFPAIWIELPESIAFTPAQQSRIQQDAETLLEDIKAAELTEFPEATKAELINMSDLDFRRKYGVRAWLAHHVQARAAFDQQSNR